MALDLSSLIRAKTASHKERFKKLHETMSLADYLELLVRNPLPARNAWQRLYDVIMRHGSKPLDGDKELDEYNFFSDPSFSGKDAIFGLNETKNQLVRVIRAGAEGTPMAKRLILLHGPVGSAKSTLARLIKKELELYTFQDAGAIYTFGWRHEGDEEIEDERRIFSHDGKQYLSSQMNEDPLLLLPKDMREEFIGELNAQMRKGNVDERNFRQLEHYFSDGKTFQVPDKSQDVCPAARQQFAVYYKRCKGDVEKLFREYVAVRRFTFSEADRIGIGTFQPKDEKNQDSTELTGDINYRKIALYGSDSDPRAFNYDGEFCIANRGIVEFVEILKLDTAFLYDLLGATQESRIKPKKQPQIDIDQVIIGHTNNPEYRKLQENDLMEAIRDRIERIDVPYELELDEEIRIYERDFKGKQGPHIAPHTITIGAFWAIMSRLDDAVGTEVELSLPDKLRLYNGEQVKGITPDKLEEIRELAQAEGMAGVSPRYVQNALSLCQVSAREGCVNPLDMLKELKDGLGNNSLIKSKDIEEYGDALELAKEEFERLARRDVRQATSYDTEELQRVFNRYIRNLEAYCEDKKVKNEFGQYEEPDEKFMKRIEQSLESPIRDSIRDDWRKGLMSTIGAYSVRGESFEYNSNPELQIAIERVLYDQRKDFINLKMLNAREALSEEQRQRVERIHENLKDMGYCGTCADRVLNYVGSLEARASQDD